MEGCADAAIGAVGLRAGVGRVVDLAADAIAVREGRITG
jgi:hypothetical protein